MNWIQIISLTVLVSLLAAVSGQTALYRVADVLIVVSAASFGWSRLSVRFLRLGQVVHQEVAQVGDVIEQRFELQSLLPLPGRRIEVSDGGSLADSSVSSVVSLDWRTRRAVTLPVVCHRRGRHELGPARLSGSDPFGFFWTSRRAGPVRPVLVCPAVLALPRFALPSGRGINGGRHLSNASESILQVSGVREYRPGDPVNHIHWRTTARASRLVVKEFSPGPTISVWVVLDLDAAAHRGVGRESTVEYGVTVAASLVQHFLGEGRKVGIVATDAQYRCLELRSGRGQLQAALELFAVVQADGRAPLAEVLDRERRRWSRSSAVVVVTPSGDHRWPGAIQAIVRQGNPSGVVVLDPTTFGAGPVPLEGADVVTGGVPTIVVRRGVPLEKSLAVGWR